MIKIIDNVLTFPMAYRAAALAQTFKDVVLGADTFRGISVTKKLNILIAAAEVTDAEPVLSYFRKSPKGQEEPNYIHTDEMMGNFTGIYYMNPVPEMGDGTILWKKKDDGWDIQQMIEAKFNRLVVFDADIPHSRALFDNYGQGDDARLIQAVFLR